MPLSTYLPDEMGTAEIDPKGAFEAGSHASFTLTYTAGKFGIDDTGSLKVVHRFASDMGRPQFDNPSGVNFVSVEASNGAVLDVRYDKKMNIRPWDKTLYIKVVRGYLKEGDEIIVRFGDTRQGSPGMRLQTFCEETFEFRVLVDAIATCDYVELPEQPMIAIVPGPPANWVAVLPTERPINTPFRLCLKGEDRWGNPSDKCDAMFRLAANKSISGLPDTVTFSEGEFSCIIPDLSVGEPGDLVIDLRDHAGDLIAQSNPMRIVDEMVWTPVWGDLHGQSEETIGTNSVHDYFSFGRDKAFADILGHQGNDFQITKEFWTELNQVTRDMNVPGEFVTIPGYEWSGNTGIGGDRNVFYLQEDRQIYRSSHALVEDHSDIHTDAHNVEELFDKLKEEDCIVHAHIGGRYADVDLGHDIRIERAFEVHSAWGTFEWLIEDGFRNGFRVGIVANSDGHKGRPGASYPGASMFGSYGGLTCLLTNEFSREGAFEALRSRRHYCTSGNRMILKTHVDFPSAATLFDQDPNMGETESSQTTRAEMGDILQSDADAVTFSIDMVASAPIERVMIRNGLEHVETVRPYTQEQLGRRIRVIFEGAKYRGRGREVIWDGTATLDGNTIERVAPINYYNRDKSVDLTSPTELSWSAITTGGFCGFDAWLSDADAGIMKIDSELVQAEIVIGDIGLEDLVFDAGGLKRQMRVFRLPDENDIRTMTLERTIPLRKGSDNAIYMSMIQEDGFQVWNSPVYVFD